MGYRRPGGPPLRAAGLPALRCARHDSGLLPPLLHPRRGRRVGGRFAAGEGVLPTMSTSMESGSSPESLYQEIILDHYRTPHHRGLRDPFDAEVHHVNPTCGDEVTLRVRMADGVVADVSSDSLGCSISQASTSVMTDLVVGRPLEEALQAHD